MSAAEDRQRDLAELRRQLKALGVKSQDGDGLKELRKEFDAIVAKMPKADRPKSEENQLKAIRDQFEKLRTQTPAGPPSASGTYKVSLKGGGNKLGTVRVEVPQILRQILLGEKKRTSEFADNKSLDENQKDVINFINQLKSLGKDDQYDSIEFKNDLEQVIKTISKDDLKKVIEKIVPSNKRKRGSDSSFKSSNSKKAKTSQFAASSPQEKAASTEGSSKKTNTVFKGREGKRLKQKLSLAVKKNKIQKMQKMQMHKVNQAIKVAKKLNKRITKLKEAKALSTNKVKANSTKAITPTPKQEVTEKKKSPLEKLTHFIGKVAKGIGWIIKAAVGLFKKITEGIKKAIDNGKKKRIVLDKPCKITATHRQAPKNVRTSEIRAGKKEAKDRASERAQEPDAKQEESKHHEGPSVR